MVIKHNINKLYHSISLYLRSTFRNRRLETDRDGHMYVHFVCMWYRCQISWYGFLIYFISNDHFLNIIISNNFHPIILCKHGKSKQRFLYKVLLVIHQFKTPEKCILKMFRYATVYRKMREIFLFYSIYNHGRPYPRQQFTP